MARPNSRNSSLVVILISFKFSRQNWQTQTFQIFPPKLTDAIFFDFPAKIDMQIFWIFPPKIDGYKCFGFSRQKLTDGNVFDFPTKIDGCKFLGFSRQNWPMQMLILKEKISENIIKWV
jgi:hypothetical protein